MRKPQMSKAWAEPCANPERKRPHTAIIASNALVVTKDKRILDGKRIRADHKVVGESFRVVRMGRGSNVWYEKGSM